MKKMIIIEDENNKKYERDKNRKLVHNSIIELFIYMVGYALVLIFFSYLFESFNISLEHFGLYAFLGAIVIYILNQTIKPLLFYLTFPLTVVTLGLFYPIINVLILYFTSFILGRSHFMVSGLIGPIFVAIFISIFNMIMEGMVTKIIIRRKNG